jgi:hypothetical protein
VIHDLAGFGGRVQLIQVSRLDLCADFRLPGGITLDTLRQLKVSRSRDLRLEIGGDTMETAYVGARKAPIVLRIYDKGKEVKAKGIKLWFGELWNTEDLTDIWRVEFQLRRPALKQFGINSLDDLLTRAGGLWEYLTWEWVSFRLPDNDRQNRREVHPWWQEVQTLASKYGPAVDIQRVFGSIHPASVEWSVAHIAGCLPSFAARLGIDEYHEALNQLNNDISQHWFDRNYQGEYEKRAIKLGRNVDDQGGGYGQE